MPLTRCTKNGKRGWASHPGGHCYIGPDALSKAKNQLKAIKANQGRNNEDEATEFRVRLISPGISKIRVRTTAGSGKGMVQGVKIPSSVNVIWYIVKTSKGKEVPRAQALRFKMEKGWTMSKVKAWLKKNKVKFIKIEPPKKGKK